MKVPIARCRSAMGKMSPISAKEHGMTEAAKTPVKARKRPTLASPVPKAHRNVATVNMTIANVITCFLPYLSAKGPKRI